ncbi:MAG TPA: DUF4249 domain-containing protein [Bacteroidales bacterium]|nr:DUF4249 domain-containing protein [Bacteroidales bacterium]
MRSSLYILFLLVIISTSCEEIIDVDLSDSEPVLVSEALILKDSVCKVNLSYTYSYFNPSASPAEENAEIVLSDDAGRSEMLYHQGNGYYKGNTLTGDEGRIYTIGINIEDREYSGSAELNRKPEIVGLDYEILSIPHNTDIEPIYSVKTVFKDRSDEDNYYLFRFYRNNEMINDYFSTYGDQLLRADTLTFSDFRMDFYRNDTVRVELYAIDEALYSYFSRLNDVLFSAMSSSTPYNPQYGFSEDIMGYFMAASFDSQTIIIQ